MCEPHPNRPQRQRCVKQRKALRNVIGLLTADQRVAGAGQTAEVDVGSDFDVLHAAERGELQLKGSCDDSDVRRFHHQLLPAWGRRQWPGWPGWRSCSWGRRRGGSALKHLAAGTIPGCACGLQDERVASGTGGLGALRTMMPEPLHLMW